MENVVMLLGIAGAVFVAVLINYCIPLTVGWLTAIIYLNTVGVGGKLYTTSGVVLSAVAVFAVILFCSELMAWRTGYRNLPWEKELRE